MCVVDGEEEQKMKTCITSSDEKGFVDEDFESDTSYKRDKTSMSPEHQRTLFLKLKSPHLFVDSLSAWCSSVVTSIPTLSK